MPKQLPQKHSAKKQPDLATYRQTLRLYWQGEKDAAIALLSDALAEQGVEHPELFYRLWIEILADENDEASLRMLQAHLKNRIDYKHPSWVPTMALMGLIHYEVGELEAATMIFRSMAKHNHNPYCRELQWVCRMGEKIPSIYPTQLVKDTYDYTHFKRAALACRVLNDGKSWTEIRRDMRSLFGFHPLTREVRFHELFAAKEYRKACLVAKSLRYSFPQNIEYQFYFAFTASQIDRKKLALKEFLQLNRKLDSEDTDVLCSLGRLLIDAGSEPVSQHQLSRGKTYLRRAAEKLESSGLSAAYPNTLLRRLEDDSMSEQGHCWFLKLSQRQAYELHNRPLDRIEFLQRALGQYVKKGDICFFVSEGPAQSSQKPGDWRLLALYKAVSDPEWHHLYRWQSTLKLQVRLEVTVPITNMGNSSLAVKGSDRIGLYRIEREQLKNIEDGIRGYTLDDEAYQPIFEQWRSLIS